MVSPYGPGQIPPVNAPVAYQPTIGVQPGAAQPATLSGLGGAKVFVQATAPAPPPAIPANSLWFDTANGSMQTWTGSAWTAQQFSGQELLQAASVFGAQIAADAGILGSQISAEAAILGTQLEDNTITSAQVASGTLTAAQLASAAGILGSQIAAATIESGNIAENTIVAANIAANTISAANLVAGIVVAGIVDGTTISGVTVVLKANSSTDAAMGMETGASIEDQAALILTYEDTTEAILWMAMEGAIATTDTAAGNVAIQLASGNASTGAKGWLTAFQTVGTVRTTYDIGWWDYQGLHLELPLYGNSGTLTVGDELVMASGKTVSATDPSGGGAESWHDISPGTGFAAGGTQPRYRLEPDDTVRLSGSVNVTTSVTAGTTIATLPAAYAPASDKYLTCFSGGASVRNIEVLTTGVMAIRDASVSGDYLVLDGNTYELD